MKPVRIQLSRKKGWRMPPNTVKVDRSTKWGNPFIVGVHGTRASCARLYRYLAAGMIPLSFVNRNARHRTRKAMETAQQILRGKNLACWCPLDQLCHADVLLDIANR